MPFYEITLKATVQETMPVMAHDYDEAVARAIVKAQDKIAALPGPLRLDWEVERFLVLDDDEVVRLRQAGHAI